MGLGLSYALTITRTLSYGVRASTALENEFNSVERVQEFIGLDQEEEDNVGGGGGRRGSAPGVVVVVAGVLFGVYRLTCWGRCAANLFFVGLLCFVVARVEGGRRSGDGFRFGKCCALLLLVYGFCDPGECGESARSVGLM